MSELGECDGRELAVQLLRELGMANADATTIDADCWPEGVHAQDNIVLRYLRALRESGSADLEAGFASILTDFIGSALDGAVPDADYYEATPSPEGNG